MRQLIGVFFLALSTVLSLVLMYSLGMAIIGHYGFFGVSIGVGLSTAVSWMIVKTLLGRS